MAQYVLSVSTSTECTLPSILDLHRLASTSIYKVTSLLCSAPSYHMQYLKIIFHIIASTSSMCWSVIVFTTAKFGFTFTKIQLVNLKGKCHYHTLASC